MKNKSLSLYDFIVMLYIVSMFSFENQTYSLIFSMVQITFILATIFVVIIRRRIVSNTFLILQMGLLIIALVIEMVASSSSGTISSELYIYTGNIIKLAFLTQYLTSEEKINKTILFMLIGGLVTSVFVFFEYFSLSGIEYDLKYASNLRIGADISGGNVNITALNLCIAFSGGIYYLYKENRSFYKQLIFLLIISLIFTAMIFTGSRKVLIYCLIVFLLQTFFKSKRKFIWATIVVVAIYICVINIEVLYFYIGHKIDIFGSGNKASLYANSDAIRSSLILGGFQLFSNNIFGVGLGGVARELGNYAHNNFIEILTSLGIIGFIVYYSIYIYPLIKLRKIAIPKELFIYFVSSILALLVIEWYQVTYLYKIPMMFLTLAASCASIKRRKEFEDIK
ncbi:O-antigen ligase [Peribacillus sp. V2I11]|uniref:O-antigen ligase family protein n=1 Tax=Peribacillus sp. V2I11 TaxID=3042277 RepID=UPI0027893BF0|nr:O-antigen ligase family protein [Peribacillus sp. V2I11]MDQ0883019.1 O-antigen ligase [Peribacillus sp. V2I11]